MSTLVKNVLILGFGAIAVIYLLNPTAGFLEFIPDNFPIVGNLDEAGAMFILFNTLAYFGLDMTRLFGRANKPKSIPSLYQRDAQTPPPMR